jgi:NADH:ubiquinone oxidoreductase subunit 6 (subunit J)
MITNFFIFLALVSGFGSIGAFSPHTAVYFIILCFLATGVVFYMFSCTYISMMLFIVYVGAIAMLFVFCIILLNLDSKSLHSRFHYYIFPVIFASFFMAIFFMFNSSFVYDNDFFFYSSQELDFGYFTKDSILLYSFYSFFIFHLIFLGFILFFVTVATTTLIG